MLTRFAFAVLACLVATTASADTDYRALFDRVWSTVDDNFYDPKFHGVDWRAVGGRYRTRLAGVTTDKQFDALVSAMLAEIGTTHIYIVAPKGSAASGAGIGVRLRDIEGAMVVTTVAPLSDAHMQGVHPGDLLLSPRDALSGPVGMQAAARVQSCNGNVHELTLRRIGAFWPPPHPAFEWQASEIAPHKSVGYIRIDRFDDGAAALADRAMDELKDMSALIIDLRGNSGGNASATRLYSYFAGDAEPVFALFARPYLQTLDHAVTKADVLGAARITGAYTDEAIFAAVTSHKGAATFWSEDLRAKHYGKPVIVLIGEDTGSAAEGFAWEMRLLPQVKFIGRKTAGALLSAQDFDLPGGWRLTIPVQGVWGADGTDYRDRAVAPDVAVAWTRRDLCTGRDPDIAAAMGMVGE
ncbi:MAG TPA: S41 family peptidase [Rhizomicrobium sp.]|nr:S41 family peptidase [Rhizomicrobium sp.]